MKVKALALAVFLVCCAFGQQILPVNQQQGSGSTPPAGNCAYAAQVGNFWNQIGGAANVSYICQQTGNGTLPTFGWSPIQLQASGSGTTGTLTVASGKAAAINNSLTFAGTDSTTMTFPTTSATIARTDAGQTFTGVDVFTSPTLNTPNVTLPVIEDTTDTTKNVIFSISGGTTGVATTLSFAPTAARTVTFPNASITVPGIIVTGCGSSSSCASPTTLSSTAKIVVGQIAFSAATTATVTGISPAFTAIGDFTCYASDPTHSYTVTISNQSSSSFTITSGTSNSDTWNYQCVGY